MEHCSAMQHLDRAVDAACETLRVPLWSENKLFVRKIRAPIKIKSALPPPKKTPPKKGEFYGHGFSCRKNAFFQVSIKLAHPIPAPELRTRILRTRGFFWFWHTQNLFLPVEAHDRAEILRFGHPRFGNTLNSTALLPFQPTFLPTDYHWGQNSYMFFFRFEELSSVIATGTLGGISYCNVMIGAIFPWQERIFRLRLQFISPCYVWELIAVM